MLKHVVLLKFKENYDRDLLDAAIKKMNDLPGQIPQIVSFAHGRNAGVTDDQFDYGVVAEFATGEECLAYLEHPAHKAVGGDIRQLVDNAAQMQFEC